MWQSFTTSFVLLSIHAAIHKFIHAVIHPLVFEMALLKAPRCGQNGVWSVNVERSYKIIYLVKVDIYIYADNFSQPVVSRVFCSYSTVLIVLAYILAQTYENQQNDFFV